MIPIRDENPTRTVSYVTFLLIVCNVLVFLYQVSLPSQKDIQAFFANFALIPAHVLNNASAATYGTMLSSMFLHGGWAHLIGNMWFLWIFGNNIEDAVGHIKFFQFYVLCGLAAAGVQIAINPDSVVPMVGASGAISGVLGGYLLLYPHARVLTVIPIFFFIRILHIKAWLFLIFWFVIQFLSGLAILGVETTGGVAFWAHIGGFVAGFGLIIPFSKKRIKLFR